MRQNLFTAARLRDILAYDINPQKRGGVMKKELIHSRKITVNCYETDEERLIVEGKRSIRGKNPPTPSGSPAGTEIMSQP